MTDETHGMKVSAGTMLSKFLRQIGQEHTEVAGMDPVNGRARMVTKAEQLARTMWRLALGWVDEAGKTYKPDNAMIALIFDRIEGKVVSTESDKVKKQPLSGKVTDQAQRRVNALIRGGDDGGGTETTP